MLYKHIFIFNYGDVTIGDNDNVNITIHIKQKKKG